MNDEVLSDIINVKDKLRFWLKENFIKTCVYLIKLRFDNRK